MSQPKSQLGIIAPVNLNIGNAASASRRASRQQRSSDHIASAILSFLCKVESLASLGISEQAIGTLVSAMPFINPCRLQSTLGNVQLLQEALTILNPFRSNALQKIQLRNTTSPHRLLPKRIISFAQRTAAITFNSTRKISHIKKRSLRS